MKKRTLVFRCKGNFTTYSTEVVTKYGINHHFHPAAQETQNNTKSSTPCIHSQTSQLICQSTIYKDIVIGRPFPLQQNKIETETGQEITMSLLAHQTTDGNGFKQGVKEIKMLKDTRGQIYQRFVCVKLPQKPIQSILHFRCLHTATNDVWVAAAVVAVVFCTEFSRPFDV